MKPLRLIAIVTIAAAAVPASASSPAAWAGLNRAVNRACLAGSGLLRAKIVADKASFPDTVPVELRIVEGYSRGGVVDVKLCAYDRRTRRPAFTDGVGRLGVNRH